MPRSTLGAVLHANWPNSCHVEPVTSALRKVIEGNAPGMLDEGSKVTLFVIAVVLCGIAIVTERSSPRPELATAVDTARLPPLPFAAASDGSPAQTAVTARRLELSDGFEAELMHGYVLEGRVVTRRQYRYSRVSAISPLDLGIVWGDLAEPGGSEDIAFKPVHRAIWAEPSAEAALPDNWREQITNNHLIPGNQAVSDALMGIEIGSHVRISGYLVSVTGDRIRPWRSSTRRDDSTGVSGCEIILVTKVKVLSGRGQAA